MNEPFIVSRNLHFKPIIHHIKGKSNPALPEPRQLIRPVQIPVKLPSARSRSFSANNKFRNLFQIPSKPSNKVPKSNSKQSSPMPNKNKSHLRDINDVFSVRYNENEPRRIRIKEENRHILRNIENNVKVNRIMLPVGPSSPLKGVSEHLDELVTFRPEMTPSKKQFRFPRNVFCIENKKKCIS